MADAQLSSDMAQIRKEVRKLRTAVDALSAPEYSYGEQPMFTTAIFEEEDSRDFLSTVIGSE